MPRQSQCGRAAVVARSGDACHSAERVATIGTPAATPLALGSENGYTSDMSTLAEIEAAVDALPPAEKQQLLLFIAARLRSEGGSLPAPRKFTREQVDAWIAEDE